MRKLIFALFLLFFVATPVHALELTAPEAPSEAENYMPEENRDFASGFLEMLESALGALRPDIKEAARVCLGLFACVLLISILQSMSEGIKRTSNLAGTAAVSASMLLSVNSLIPLASETIQQMCTYGKLLLPVMTSGLAAQGAGATSAALYAGTAMFISLISSLVSSVLVPMVYMFLALCIISAAVGEGLMKRMGEGMKTAVSWCLKTVLTLFTTYMSITGVVSGTADAAALKAAKAAISTAVPVVGGILSNATESVLAGAAAVKSAAGIYGIFAVLAIFLEPFLRIGVHYLMLKVTAALCGIFGCKEMTELIGDFSTGMGLLLAMTGSVCLMLMISTVCFLKGVG